MARLMHHGTFAGAVVLNASNSVTALQHTAVMLQAITVDTQGAEILRMMGVLVQAVIGNVLPILANVSLTESHLQNDQLLDRLLRPDAIALSPADRVTMLITEYASATERRNAAPRSEAEPERLLGGYTR